MPPRFRPLAAAGLVVAGSLSIQVSAAIVYPLFDSVGSMGVSAIRMLIAAVVLLVVVRPSFRGRSRTAWLGIVLYGVSMAAMNLMFYLAVQQLPLGMAVTLEFLGPLTIAAIGATRKLELVLPAITLLGVFLISSPDGGMNLLGLAFGLGAALAFAGYTLLATKVGGDNAGLDGLTLSVLVGALVLSPLAIEAAPRVDLPALGLLAISGVLGVAICFSLDFMAIQLTSSRVVGTLFAFDPVVATLVGALLLGQALAVPVTLGIVLVVLSGAAVIWLAGKRHAAENRGANSGKTEAEPITPSPAI